MNDVHLRTAFCRWPLVLAMALLTGCFGTGGTEAAASPEGSTTLSPVDASEVDTLFFVEAVLERFEPGEGNGPVVEIVDGFWCPPQVECAEHPPSRERIRGWAEEQGLRLVPADAAPLPCTWNRVTDSEWRGRRMQIRPPAPGDGGIWRMWVSTVCQVHETRGFLFGLGYEFERTADGWRATGRVASIIT